MAAVIFELRAPTGWERIGTVADSVLPGSISSTDEAGHREVYIFGWVEGDGPGVWRSRLGIDVEIQMLRVTDALLGLEKLSDLDDPYELLVRRPDGRQMTVRFRRA